MDCMFLLYSSLWQILIWNSLLVMNQIKKKQNQCLLNVFILPCNWYLQASDYSLTVPPKIIANIRHFIICMHCSLPLYSSLVENLEVCTGWLIVLIVFQYFFFHGLLFLNHKKPFKCFSILKQITTHQPVPKFHQTFAPGLNFKEELWWLKSVSQKINITNTE